MISQTTSLVNRILARYHIAPVEIRGHQSGYRNHTHPVVLADNTLINLIIYKSEPQILRRIQRAHAVSDYIAATSDLPVRHPIDSRILTLRTPTKIKYAAVYNYLSGHTIPWESYTQAHIKALGASLSDLHAALQGFTHPALKPHTDSIEAEYLPLLEEMQRYFSRPTVQNALNTKLGIVIDATIIPPFIQLLRATPHLPHRQPLHMDFVRSNILFSKPSEAPKNNVHITGILDFEKAVIGHPLFDIARTLAFLLVDCHYKTPSQVRKYFLYSGYHKRGSAPLPRIRLRNGLLLDTLTDLFLLYDFYKFLRHNPYESLQQNQHYLRTRNLLIKHNLIRRRLSR